MSNRKDVYVYVYLDPRKPGCFCYGQYEFDHQPIYVGKGRRYRMRDHISYVRTNKPRTRNRLKFNKIKKILDSGLEPIIKVALRNATDKEALELERGLIANIGRIDLESGPLTNLTSGGEGTGGYIFTPEQREKLSRAHIGKTLSDEHRRRIGEASKRRWANPEYRKMMSQKQKGKRMSPDAVQKRIATFKERGHGRWMRGRTLPDSTKKRMSESACRRKLTAGEVREIRRLFDAGGITQTAIAKMFPVTISCINSIVRRKTWRYLDEVDGVA